MGVYRRHVVPRIVNVCCGMTPAQTRERVYEGLFGEVLEIGFGSGLNVPFYPPGVTRVLAVEPSDVGYRLAGTRLAASSVPVERIGLDGQHLPLDDDSVDAALSTWTMCTVPDVEAALREVRRVLKPGGRLHFVEHCRSPDARVARWQHRLDGLQGRVAGGCHIDRPIGRLMKDAGLRLEHMDNSYEKATPKPMGYLYEGVAMA
jgi:SAM-dependent methyltransferase